MLNIKLLPIDNRPITYTLLEQIASIDKGVKLDMPERKFLGGLFYLSDIEEIINWLKKDTVEDFIILSLDTIAYGGLISSRRSNEAFDEIKARLLLLKDILKTKKEKNKNLKIYATSSIMRISNNNVNEEEKPYWNIWGKKIFEYSYWNHRQKVLMEMNCVINKVPEDILEDYLQTRKRNFEINRLYFDFLEEGVFDFVVFSKDDTGKYGFNVEEGEKLQIEAKKRNLNAIVKTGADEIPMGLFLKALSGKKPVKIKTVYKNQNSTSLVSRYEDLPVKDCVEGQIKIGLENALNKVENPDVVLYVNNFDVEQGDLVFQDVVNEGTFKIDKTVPYIIADINNANGSDSKFVEEFIKDKADENFLGYSGYNTSANTIGSALAIGIMTYFAKKEGRYNKEAFKDLIATRLLDDWAYQANIRKKIQNIEDKDFEKALKNSIEDFRPYEDKIKNFIEKDFRVEYSLPWKRSFEAEFKIGEK